MFSDIPAAELDNRRQRAAQLATELRIAAEHGDRDTVYHRLAFELAVLVEDVVAKTARAERQETA